ncbi:MAG: accessory gene regulator B family protein [Ruminococcus sp.]|nr:accessory gene regulator B family protein [Ruminococcus sp.]
MFDITFAVLFLPVIFNVDPIPHPNKPMSKEKGVILKRKSRILVLLLSMCVVIIMIFQIKKLSLYVSSGILLS